MATPIINFQSLSGEQVAAQYENLPAGSQVVFVNKTSGQVMPSPVTPASGSGTLSMTFSAGSGAYYLRAQDHAGAYLAQSVVFYVT
jgi:hypothetical protein